MAKKLNWSLKVYVTAVLGGVAVIAGAIIVLAADRPAKEGAKPRVREDNSTNFPVHIRKPAGPPRVATGVTNFHGEAATVSCSTCHASTTPNLALRRSEELDEFHQGLVFNHGQLSCLSCHNSGNYDSLRLADGTAVDFENVQQLCAQCHGPQTRDYRNGSHGGMNGYLDLKRGPRTRNNCTDCHDAHSPQYQAMMPVFAPLPTGKQGKKSH
jgi:hypothetical protein